jgi:hypothetical protein
MARNSGQRIISVLDWLWPFPLGLFVVTLVVIVPLGLWLATRAPRSPKSAVPPDVHTATEATAPAPSLNTPPIQTTIPQPTITPQPAQPKSSEPIPSPAEARTQAASPVPPARPAPSKLSAKQQADINDRLTIGRFLMERKDYVNAIENFQAALAIDPANRKAQEALQEARRANQQSEATAKP